MSIAGNENFTNVSTLANHLPSLDAGILRTKALKGFATRPPLSGLGAATVTIEDGTAATLEAGRVHTSNWTGATADTTVTLPSAIEGSTLAVYQNALPQGDTNTLFFDCAGTDAFVANSCVNYAPASVSSNVLSNAVALDFSERGETILQVSGVSAGPGCIFSLGSVLFFNCTQNGLWQVSHILRADVTSGGANIPNRFTFAA
jgi:hypothetical protein